MDFCGNCGILLSEDLSYTQFYCNPCKDLSLSAQAPFEHCRCEICCSGVKNSEVPFLDVDAANNTFDSWDQEQSLSSDVKYQRFPQSQRKRFKRNKTSKLPSSAHSSQLSSTQTSKNKKESFTVESCSGSVTFPTASKESDAGKSIKSSSNDVNDDKSRCLISDNHSTSVLCPLQPDNMGIISSSSKESKSVSKPSENDKDEKSTKKRKDYHLVEEVRVQWEREQNEYRQQLLYEDTADIAALVSGQRRKSDGRRYFVGGVDISFIKGNNEDACACLSVLRMPDLKLVYQRLEMVKLTQPYIPGFLAFREVPALQPLFSHLKATAPKYWPDITLVDGNGILHPRGFGLACQLGVVLNIPTMGIAKSLISAQGISEDQEHKKVKKSLTGAGDGFDLISDNNEVLGKCVRVHDNAPNPVYVSLGHKVSLASAVWIALECSKFRIPEPVRRADLDSREYLRQGKTEVEEFLLSESEDEG